MLPHIKLTFTPGPERINANHVGHEHLHMFGWTWITRLITAEDVGKRVYMAPDEYRIMIEGDE